MLHNSLLILRLNFCMIKHSIYVHFLRRPFMGKTGFDNDKYLKLQSEKIKERIAIEKILKQSKKYITIIQLIGMQYLIKYFRIF